MCRMPARGAASRAGPFDSASAVTPERRLAARTGGAGATRLSPALRAAGISACPPFGAYEAVAARLGPGHPRAVSVDAEACSTSVAGTPASCYSNQDPDRRSLPLRSRAAFDAAAATPYLARGQPRVGRGLQRDQFSGRADSAGEL